jgi:hypothetical protein
MVGFRFRGGGVHVDTMVGVRESWVCLAVWHLHMSTTTLLCSS